MYMFGWWWLKEEKLWIDGCSMIAGVKVEGKKSKRYKDN
jgi:hypothetical protein